MAAREYVSIVPIGDLNDPESVANAAARAAFSVLHQAVSAKDHLVELGKLSILDEAAVDMRTHPVHAAIRDMFGQPDAKTGRSVMLIATGKDAPKPQPAQPADSAEELTSDG